MPDFVIKHYTVRSGKLRTAVRALLLADLHETQHGRDNTDLLRAAGELRPDFVLLAGDMIVGRPEYSHVQAVRVIRALASMCPVFAVNGNHETQLRMFRSDYRNYIGSLKETGTRLVNNRTAAFSCGENRFRITGLELPGRKYRKFRIPALHEEELAGLIGSCADGDDRELRILLAHNPQFTPQYFRWGADLTVCGHFHGGVARLFGNQVAMSPYGFPLPKYGYGLYAEGEKTVIVTSGLGDHAIPVRVFNPMEMVCIDLIPDSLHASEQDTSPRRSVKHETTA